MKTRAAVLYEYGSGLTIEELHLDSPKENEVLVKNMAAGLCHTDLSVMNGAIRMPPLPCVPGHEGAGIIQEVGPGVTDFKPGDHVLLVWVPICGECYYCLRGQPYLCEQKDKTRGGAMLDGTNRLWKGTRPINSMLGVGCFTEYNVVSEKSVIKIDHEIPFELAAVVGCGVITGVGAVLNKARVPPGSTVAVMGSGGVGLNVIQGAVLADCAKIIAIDIFDHKLELAKSFGATHVVNASQVDPVKAVFEFTSGIGADYAFEVVGSASTTQSTFRSIRRGGAAVVLGVPGLQEILNIPAYEIPVLGKDILGCNYGSGNVRVDLMNLLGLYRQGRLNLERLISHRYTLEDIETGFKDLEAGLNVRGMILYS